MKYRVVLFGLLTLTLTATALAGPPRTDSVGQRFEGCKGSFTSIAEADRLLPLHSPVGGVTEQFYGSRISNVHLGYGGWTASRCYHQLSLGPGLFSPHPRPSIAAPYGLPPFGLRPFGITNFLPDDVATKPPETCAISTGNGLLQDRDCDDVPNRVDNCVDTPNPRQADQNKNGRGDACDLYIASFTVEPQKLSCGQSTMATARIVNNAPAPFANVKATFNIGELADKSTNIRKLTPGAAQTVELTASLPHDAATGQHTSVFTLQYNDHGRNGGTRVAHDVEVTGEACGPVAQESFVRVREIEDVDAGETAVYPMKITNTHDTAKSFDIVVEGIDFGTYTLEPGSVTIIGPGETRTVYLSVHVDEDVGEGSKSFTVDVQQGDDARQVTLVADIHPAS